jgi:CYTH domain-containing protein
MSPTAIEIERKFRLRAAPSPEVLAAHGAEARRIEQVYLGGGRDAERIRRIETAAGIGYRHTRKRRIGPYAFEEQEEAIDEAAWRAGLERADPARRPIRKTRHVVPHGDQLLEIDVFDDPPGLVVVEVELRHEDEPVDLPGWLGEWVEVTGDVRYFNAVLARLDAEVPPWGPEVRGIR